MITLLRIFVMLIECLIVAIVNINIPNEYKFWGGYIVAMVVGLSQDLISIYAIIHKTKNND